VQSREILEEQREIALFAENTFSLNPRRRAEGNSAPNALRFCTLTLPAKSLFGGKTIVSV